MAESWDSQNYVEGSWDWDQVPSEPPASDTTGSKNVAQNTQKSTTQNKEKSSLDLAFERTNYSQNKRGPWQRSSNSYNRVNSSRPRGRSHNNKRTDAYEHRNTGYRSSVSSNQDYPSANEPKSHKSYNKTNSQNGYASGQDRSYSGRSKPYNNHKNRNSDNGYASSQDDRAKPYNNYKNKYSDNGYSSSQNYRSDHGSKPQHYNSDNRGSRSGMRGGRGNRNYHDRASHNSGGRDAHSNQTGQSRRYPMSNRQLLTLLDKEPDELMLQLKTVNSDFEYLLKQNEINPKTIALILQILSMACQANQIRNLSFLMEIVNGSHFLHIQVPKFLVEVRLSLEPAIYLDSIPCLVQYLDKFQKIQPVGASETVSILIPQIRQILEKYLDEDNNLDYSILDEFSYLEAENERLISIYCGQDRKKKIFEEQQRSKEPPTNFRTVSIYPTEDELSGNEPPFLRSNVIDGCYLDVEHYLDVQFRLLREDFVQPLRQGINDYRHLSAEGNRFKRVRDLSIYTNVHILFSRCNIQGIQHRIQFDNSRFKHINWNVTKRFLNGSLLCFSSDNFKTMIFGCVVERDEMLLRGGFLGICFEERNRRILNISPNEEFVMVETNAFFEAYRHNLKALQRMDDNNFPLKEYIVSVEKEVKPPKYLTASKKYDLRPLLLPFPNEFKENKSNYEENSHHGFGDSDGFPPTTNWVREIPILNDDEWPPHDDLNLDISQYRALKMALTKEFAVIQGPPGTGKTFIGLRVVQVLIQNEKFWNPHESSPMLIVCFTNHALDQFLEGILKLVPKNYIVRVGGRCTSLKLEDCRLMNMRQASRMRQHEKKKAGSYRGYENSMDKTLRQNRYQCTTQILVLESKLKVAEMDIKRACQDCLTEEDLRPFMTPEQFECFVDKPTESSAYSDGKVIMDWLELRYRDVQTVENESSSDDELPEEKLPLPGQGEEPPEEAKSNAYEDYFDDPGVEDDIMADEREIDDYIEQESKQKFMAKFEERAEGDWTRTPGWKTRKAKIRERFQNIKKPMNKEEAEAILDIHKLLLPKRWLLYNYWAESFVTDKHLEISNLQDKFDEQLKILAELKQMEDLNLMKQCKVVGMTTTGAAKYHNLLQDLKPSIVIVEEAAEVMEAHIVTALTKDTKHLILIGDHQQLRPNPASYNLAKEYNLNISLFERMVSNNMPCQQLVMQHRMRPCIASLLVPTIYPVLKDGPKVKLYEKIKGVKHNMYFLSHDYIEGNEQDSFSKSNIHEAAFLIKLAKYFVQQGYLKTEITILATYSGQCNSLKRLAAEVNLKELYITSVDNYQGEENEIILVSLVRSNTIGSIGFLDTSNRVCVALSRARKGLYCIGNFRLLSEESDLWKKIVTKLEDMDAIGIDLRLYCENHPDTYKDVCKENDFASVPEGGCTRLCQARLHCGHACNRCCHPYDKDHEYFQCKEKCHKITCSYNHRCPKSCYQCFENENGCGPCIVKVCKELPCGHEVMLACSENPKEAVCKMVCGKPLSKCAHFCAKNCGEPCETKCKLQVKKIGLCGHTINAECHESNKPTKILTKCSKSCGMNLDCGHKCTGTCGSCYQGRLHMPCKEKCTRLLVCGHECTAPCSATCPACSHKCETVCPHSRCPKICGVPCEPCRMPCQWQCKHKRCKNICSEPCSRDLCYEPCPVILNCQHQCIGFCGEPCPKSCKICTKKITEVEFGFEDEPDSKYVVLPCKHKHVFESKGLFEWFKTFVNEDNIIRMPRCPQCQEAIRHCDVIGNFIKKALSGVEKVKEKVFGQKKENATKLRDLKVFLNSLNSPGRVNKVFSKPLVAIQSQTSSSALESGKLVFLHNFLVFIQTLDKAEGELWNCKENVICGTQVYGMSLNEHLFVSLERLVTFITVNCERPNQQHISDLDMEVTRYKTIVQMVTCVDKVGGPKKLKKDMEKKYKEALGLLLEPKMLKEKAFETCFNHLQDLKHYSGLAKIGLSEIEKKAIVQAVGLSQGHWYQCPNGHVYCIGECGGATELGKCNECQEKIGGLNHALLDNNRLAGEMDGARHSSWSDAANLNNYEFNELEE